MLAPLFTGFPLFLVKFFLCLLYCSFNCSLFFFNRLKELIGSGRERGYQFAISKDNSLTAFLNDNTFQLFYFFQFTFADFTCYLPGLDTPNGTTTNNVDAVNRLLVTTIASLFSLAFSIQLGTLCCLQSLLCFFDYTLVRPFLLANRLLLLACNIAIQRTTCNCVSYGTYTVGKPTFII